jgi:hypothetical protein
MASEKRVGKTMSHMRPQDIIEQFEIPEEYHHAIWEAYSAGADYGFFRALGKDLHPTPRADTKVTK